MTDIFAQQGITFQSSGMASTNPTATPAGIPAPKVDLPPQDATPIVSTAPKGNANMSEQDKAQAMNELYGDGAEAGGSPAPAAPSAAPPAMQQPVGRDIFSEMGIDAPDVSATNTVAFSNGVPLPPQKDISEKGIGETLDSWKPMSRADMSLPPEMLAAKQAQEKQAQVYAAQDYAQVLEVAKGRFGEDKVKEWQDNPIRFVEGFQKLRAGQFVDPTGMAELGYHLDIADIAKKKHAGEQLTSGEETKLNAFIDDQLEQRIRGWHWSGNIAYIGSQIPAFALEFAATDGVGKLAQAATTKALEETAVHSAISSITSGVARIATTTALMPGQYLPKYGERRLNDAISVTDRGETVLKDSAESPAKSFLMGFGYSALDNFTQTHIAPGIGKYAIDPLIAKAATPLTAGVNRLPAAVKDAVYQAYKVIQPNAQVSKVFTAMGWNGALEQLGANRVNEIMHATLGIAGEKDMTWDDYADRLKSAVWPSREQFMTEAALVAIGGSVSMGARASFNLMRAKGIPAPQAKDTVDNMSALEHEAYIQQNMPTPESGYPRISMKPVVAFHTPDEVTAFAHQRLAQLNEQINNRKGGDSSEETRKMRAEREFLNNNIHDHQALADGYNIGLLEVNAPTTETAPTDPNMKTLTVEIKGKPSDKAPSEEHMSQKSEEVVNRVGKEELDHYYKTNYQDIPAKDYDPAVHGSSVILSDGTVSHANGIIHEELAKRAYDHLGLKAPGSDGAGFDMIGRTGAVRVSGFSDPSAPILFESRSDFNPKQKSAIRAIVKNNPGRTFEFWKDGRSLGTTLREFEANSKPPAPLPEVITPQIATETILYDSTVGRNQLDAAEAATPPPINDSESMFNMYYRAFHHDAAAAEIPYKNAVKAGITPGRLDNTPLWIALNHQIPVMVDYYVNKGTFALDKEGYPVENGKSLKATFDDFDNYFLAKEPNMETRRVDFSDFLLARHYQALEKHAPDIIVTDEQKVKSAADMQRLADKYGEDFKFFETFGDEFVSFRKRTRDLLVGTLLTKEQRGLEDKRYPYSIPLQREVTPEQHQAGLVNGDYAGLNPGNLTKRLKGSALPVKDIVQSTLREAARTIDFVYRNRVANSLYNLREFAPDQVQVTERPTIKKGTAEFTVNYDPKLRAKLDKMIEFLGVGVERGDSIPGAPKGTIGSYSPMESLIRLRLGGTDGTRAHEAGHALDDKIGLQARMLKDPEIKAELQKLAEDRLSGEFSLSETADGVRFHEEVGKSPQKYIDYIKSDSEVLANFFDAYVFSPEQVAETAPKALAAFEAIIDDNPQLAFIREIKPSTNRGSEKIKKDVFGKGDIPPNTVPFWKDGKEVLLKLSKPMFESMSSMRPSQLNVAEKFFYGALRIVSGAPLLRYGATITPEFIERNVVKDSLEATVQSGVKYNPTSIPRAFFRILTGHADYRDFIKSGGKFGKYMPLDDGNIEKSFEDIINPKSRLYKILRHPLEHWELLPQVSDNITRYGVYAAAIKAGYSPIEAAHYATDATLQFPRGGTISKKINKVVPFFNVGLLATEKLVRAFKDDPKTMILRTTVALTVPALGISGYYLYGADEETRQAWLEIPIDRITSGQIPFNYNKATGEWNYIPTPYALGYLGAGLPMLSLRQMQKDAPEDGRAMWEHLMRAFVGSISPINDWSSVIPPTLKVMAEDTSNYDYFRGREIYSKFKEGPGVLDKDKSNAYDSETSKLIGSYFNSSPALIDHTVTGLTGGLGRYGLKLSDSAINTYRRSQDIPVPEKPTTATTGPLGGFTMRAPQGMRSNSYQAFQTNYLAAQSIVTHLKNMESGPEKAAYQRENARIISQFGLIGQKGQLKVAHVDIQEKSKQISKIYSDVHMTGDEKQQRILTLEKEITRVARNSNNQYNAATKAGN